jgi:hypothetical protein
MLQYAKTHCNTLCLLPPPNLTNYWQTIDLNVGRFVRGFAAKHSIKTRHCAIAHCLTAYSQGVQKHNISIKMSMNIKRTWYLSNYTLIAPHGRKGSH